MVVFITIELPPGDYVTATVRRPGGSIYDQIGTYDMTSEETYYERDSSDKKRQQTSETTTYSNIKHAPCRIEDDSGSVAIDLESATVEGVDAFDETKGDVRATEDLVGSLVGIGRDNTTFRHRERNLPADIAVYVLAEVHNGGGIGAPAKGSRNDTFLVSIKSEEARTEELASTMTFLIWLIGMFAIAGAALLVWARIKGQA